VNTSDLFTIIFLGKVKCEASDTFRFGGGDDFKSFNYSRDRLVFESRVFAFCVFLLSVLSTDIYSDDCEIDIFMTSFEAGNVFDEDDAGVDIKTLT
jgi:hypothetical protein